MTVKGWSTRFENKEINRIKRYGFGLKSSNTYAQIFRRYPLPPAKFLNNYIEVDNKTFDDSYPQGYILQTTQTLIDSLSSCAKNHLSLSLNSIKRNYKNYLNSRTATIKKTEDSIFSASVIDKYRMSVASGSNSKHEAPSSNLFIHDSEYLDRVRYLEKDVAFKTPEWNLVADSPNLKLYSHDFYPVSTKKTLPFLFFDPTDRQQTEYFVTGTIEDVKAENFLAVQTDLSIRIQWDDYLEKLNLVHCDPFTGTEVINWVVNSIVDFY